MSYEKKIVFPNKDKLSSQTISLGCWRGLDDIEIGRRRKKNHRKEETANEDTGESDKILKLNVRGKI